MSKTKALLATQGTKVKENQGPDLLQLYYNVYEGARLKSLRATTARQRKRTNRKLHNQRQPLYQEALHLGSDTGGGGKEGGDDQKQGKRGSGGGGSAGNGGSTAAMLGFSSSRTPSPFVTPTTSPFQVFY